jgi:hypothetical protein
MRRSVASSTSWEFLASSKGMIVSRSAQPSSLVIQIQPDWRSGGSLEVKFVLQSDLLGEREVFVGRQSGCIGPICLLIGHQCGQIGLVCRH